jgi:hypothetical protein
MSKIFCQATKKNKSHANETSQFVAVKHRIRKKPNGVYMNTGTAVKRIRFVEDVMLEQSGNRNSST